MSYIIILETIIKQHGITPTATRVYMIKTMSTNFDNFIKSSSNIHLSY